MTALTVETMEELITAACRAPSSHNTQPWLFRGEGDVIDVYADRTRALPVNDPADRELTISCGAALFNLQVAADAAGLSPVVHAFPDAHDRDKVAVVRLQRGTPSRYGELSEAIGLRKTHRGRFEPDQPAPDAVSMLDSAAAEQGVVLRWIQPGRERDAVAELVADGDRAQFADRAWRDELASWMRPRNRADGLVTSMLTGWAIRLVVSHFDVGSSTAHKDQDLMRDAPLAGVLATVGDEPSDWLTAGQALQHVLLLAAAHEMAAGYSNQPCQVPHLRQRLRDSLGLGAAPQAVFRLGVPAGKGPRTPRRALTEVFMPAIDQGER
jgi:nitroreductase